MHFPGHTREYVWLRRTGWAARYWQLAVCECVPPGRTGNIDIARIAMNRGIGSEVLKGILVSHCISADCNDQRSATT